MSLYLAVTHSNCVESPGTNEPYTMAARCANELVMMPGVSTNPILLLSADLVFMRLQKSQAELLS